MGDKDVLRYEQWLDDVIANRRPDEPSTSDRLRAFVDCVRAGQTIDSDLLALVADGVERHLERKVEESNSKPKNLWPERKRGRPARNEPLASKQKKAAFIKFHRLMLPEFDGRSAPTQRELANYIECDEREIRALEKLRVPLLWKTDFDAEISRLIAVYGLRAIHVAGELYPADCAKEWVDRDVDFMKTQERIRELEAILAANGLDVDATGE